MDNVFLVVYGDVLSDIDYSEFHKYKGSIATIMLTREDLLRYGLTVLDDNYQVRIS